MLSSNTLYGTTGGRGLRGYGTVFALQTDGSGFSNVYTFMPIVEVIGTNVFSSGGGFPDCGVMLAGSVLYGTTTLGGIDGNVYALQLGSPAISLAAQARSGQLTLTWPDSNNLLQAKTDLLSVFSDVLGATSPYVVQMTNAQQFFRLKSN